MPKIRAMNFLFLIVFVNQIHTSDNLTKAIKVKYGCGCGTIPATSNTGFVTPDPIINSPNVWSFVSKPNLHPMKVQVLTNKPGKASGFIFVAPYSFSEDASIGQQGSLILDNSANPIYFRPSGNEALNGLQAVVSGGIRQSNPAYAKASAGSPVTIHPGDKSSGILATENKNLMNTDFRVQTLNGKQVLTFWQGTLATPPAYTNAPGGSSEPGSCYFILDNTYRLIKNVSAHLGFISDIHEFLLTPQNTALFLSTKTVPMDLTPFGGPKNGFVQDFAVQEIDLATNKLIFFWDALKHIPLTDSFEPASSATSTGNIWDAFHLNSIGLTDNPNDIIVSSRNAWTIYRINKPTKKIVWRLGGKQSSFKIGQGAQFSWQHDARFLPNNVVSLFDDNCCQGATVPPGTPFSHGLILQLNLDNMTASVKRTYFHNPNLNIASQGNVQSLPNGNKFIGWGQSQYYSEFLQEGNTVTNPALNLIYDAKMPGNNYTYRAYRNNWIGMPFYPPSIAVKSVNGQITAYASWNGSTQTAKWQVLAGTTSNNLLPIKTVNKNGFETAITVNNNGPFFRIKALDTQDVIIGISKIVKLS